MNDFMNNFISKRFMYNIYEFIGEIILKINLVRDINCMNQREMYQDLEQRASFSHTVFPRISAHALIRDWIGFIKQSTGRLRNNEVQKNAV